MVVLYLKKYMKIIKGTLLCQNVPLSLQILRFFFKKLLFWENYFFVSVQCGGENIVHVSKYDIRKSGYVSHIYQLKREISVDKMMVDISFLSAEKLSILQSPFYQSHFFKESEEYK